MSASDSKTISAETLEYPDKCWSLIKTMSVQAPFHGSHTSTSQGGRTQPLQRTTVMPRPLCVFGLFCPLFSLRSLRWKTVNPRLGESSSPEGGALGFSSKLQFGRVLVKVFHFTTPEFFPDSRPWVVLPTGLVTCVEGLLGRPWSKICLRELMASSPPSHEVGIVIPVFTDRETEAQGASQCGGRIELMSSWLQSACSYLLCSGITMPWWGVSCKQAPPAGSSSWVGVYEAQCPVPSESSAATSR